MEHFGTFLVIQWLILKASTAGGVGSFPDLRATIKILHDMQHGKKKKKKKKAIDSFKKWSISSFPVHF